MKKLIFLVFVVALALGGMKVYQSIKRGMVVGDAALAEFHDALSLQKESDIYDHAAAAMRSSVKKEDFLKFIGQMRAELGAFKKANRQGVNINSTNGNTTLQVSCTAYFEKGEAEEDFLFDYNSERPLLMRYDVKKKFGVSSNAP